MAGGVCVTIHLSPTPCPRVTEAFEKTSIGNAIGLVFVEVGAIGIVNANIFYKCNRSARPTLIKYSVVCLSVDLRIAFQRHIKTSSVVRVQ